MATAEKVQWLETVLGVQIPEAGVSAAGVSSPGAADEGASGEGQSGVGQSGEGKSGGIFDRVRNLFKPKKPVPSASKRALPKPWGWRWMIA